MRLSRLAFPGSFREDSQAETAIATTGSDNLTGGVRREY
jgi:hypothetical protein